MDGHCDSGSGPRFVIVSSTSEWIVMRLRCIDTRPANETGRVPRIEDRAGTRAPPETPSLAFDL